MYIYIPYIPRPGGLQVVVRRLRESFGKTIEEGEAVPGLLGGSLMISRYRTGGLSTPVSDQRLLLLSALLGDLLPRSFLRLGDHGSDSEDSNGFSYQDQCIANSVRIRVKPVETRMQCSSMLINLI